MHFNGEEHPRCYLHPKEVIVGICALCLKERLLALASKQGRHHPLPHHKDTHGPFTALRRKPSSILPRVFALAPLLHCPEPRPQRPPDDCSDEASIGSLEDSFISIKFKDNGRPMWHNKRAEASTGPSSENPRGGGGTCNRGFPKESNGGRSLVEHPNIPRGVLRWQKRVGQLLQLAWWKRSSKAGVSHAGSGGKGEGVKGRRSWIRSLTRRKTTSTKD